jgi:hypothetical protein
VFTNGGTGQLSATLIYATNGSPISGQAVTLALAPAANDQDCTAITNAAGAANCTIAKVNEPDASRIVRAFAAGVGYAPNQVDTAVTVGW